MWNNNEIGRMSELANETLHQRERPQCSRSCRRWLLIRRAFPRFAALLSLQAHAVPVRERRKIQQGSAHGEATSEG